MPSTGYNRLFTYYAVALFTSMRRHGCQVRISNAGVKHISHFRRINGNICFILGYSILLLCLKQYSYLV